MSRRLTDRLLSLLDHAGYAVLATALLLLGTVSPVDFYGW